MLAIIVVETVIIMYGVARKRTSKVVSDTRGSFKRDSSSKDRDKKVNFQLEVNTVPLPQADKVKVQPDRRLTALFRSKKKKTDEKNREVWEIRTKDVVFEKQIGVGSCGKVWLASWLGSPVAVKTFSDEDFMNTEEFVSAVRKEVELMSILHHPNIVMFLGACVTPPEMCLLLEYCAYGSLYSFLRSEKTHKVKINMNLCVKFAIDIARGVKYLHDRCNIIQRDLKSRNILVDKSLNAKVTDFGLSRNKKNGASSTNMTACGTPAWTAPEIIKCLEYTEKVDVYSFGILMWEILTREEPFVRNKDLKGIQIAYAAAEQGLRPKIPPFCPDGYSKLMQRCWDGNPDLRPDFNEVLKTLFAMNKENKRRSSILLTEGHAFEDEKFSPQHRFSGKTLSLVSEDNEKGRSMSTSSNNSSGTESEHRPTPKAITRVQFARANSSPQLVPDSKDI